MAELSIIVPVYNKSQYLDATIESILNQTFIDFELILINDGSTDTSGLQCDVFAKRDARIIVLHQANQGVHAARNAGLKIALGDFIGFVDSDDILDHAMYALLINNAHKYQADISMCGVRRISPNKIQSYGGNNVIKTYNRDDGLSGLFNGEILLSNYDKIYKCNLVKKLLFEPALFEDTYFNFEALKASDLIVYDDRIMYNYMIRDNSHSMAAFNYKYMNATLLAKKMLERSQIELPNHVNEAKAFDFTTNMIVLNMILIESNRNHSQELANIIKNLKAYSPFYQRFKDVKLKYKLGFRIFEFSTTAYSFLLRLQSTYFNSEHLSRKRKATGQSN